MGGAARFLYHRLGLPGAGLIFLLEGLGVPIPVELPLFIVGVQQDRSFWSLVALVWLSTVVGNAAGYALGYYGGRPLALTLLRWFRVSPDTWTRAESWFRRYGLRMLIATRWINWGFAQNMWLCGITRVPFRRFFPMMAVNDLLWAIGWTWAARIAVSQFRRAGAHILYHGKIDVSVAAILIVVAGAGIWLLLRWWMRRRNRPKAGQSAE